MRLESLSVFMPAYNEEESVAQALEECARALPQLAEDFEVIVVNDGSKDRTKEILDTIKPSLSFLKVCHHERNQGIGAALRTGIAEASKEFIFITSADLQFNIRELTAFIPLSKTADIVSGVRLDRHSYGWYRRMVTAINLLLLRLFFGFRTQDPNWVKLVRREVFKTIRITSPRFFCLAELLIQAKQQKYRIAEIEVHSSKRKYGKSVGGTLRAAFTTFFELCLFWLRSRK